MSGFKRPRDEPAFDMQHGRDPLFTGRREPLFGVVGRGSSCVPPGSERAGGEVGRTWSRGTGSGDRADRDNGGRVEVPAGGNAAAQFGMTSGGNAGETIPFDPNLSPEWKSWLWP